MSRKQRQMSDRSSVRSDELLSVSQGLSESSQSENKVQSSQEVPNTPTNGRIGVRRSSQLKEFSQKLSQTLTNRMDEWKGSQVVNFKTFNKLSQNCSQKLNKSEVVPLKKVRVNMFENLTSNEINDEIIENVSDSEKPKKRKIDAKVEPKCESSAQKKSRH